MRLKWDWSAIVAIADQMNCDDDFEFDVNLKERHIDSEMRILDEQLQSGIEISYDDVDTSRGIYSYKGRQVLLYIPDQSRSIESVLAGDLSKAKKFHFCECQTIQKMFREGRKERFHATTNLEGSFEVSGLTIDNQFLQGRARLQVCKHCLQYINYRMYATGSSTNKTKVFNEFSIYDFFVSHSSLFSELPSNLVPKIESSKYTHDWDSISKNVRSQANWTCSKCGVQLSTDRRLLHVHHINGVKNDNRSSNLRALCAVCHKNEHNHGHMKLNSNDIAKIHYLRRLQGITQRLDRDTVVSHVDSSLSDKLQLAIEKHKLPMPELGVKLEGSDYPVDAYWHTKKFAVRLSNHRTETHNGIKIYSLEDFIHYANTMDS